MIYTVSEAKNRLGELCDKAAAGESVVLIRGKKTLAIRSVELVDPEVEPDWVVQKLADREDETGRPFTRQQGQEMLAKIKKKLRR